MNIVITGASGFVGFNLSQYLAQKGHRITLLDRDDYCQRLVHISPLHEMPFICCDLASDRIHLPPGTDYIIHLAAMPHVDYSYHQPGKFSAIIHSAHSLSCNMLRNITFQSCWLHPLKCMAAIGAESITNQIRMHLSLLIPRPKSRVKCWLTPMLNVTSFQSNSFV